MRLMYAWRRDFLEGNFIINKGALNAGEDRVYRSNEWRVCPPVFQECVPCIDVPGGMYIGKYIGSPEAVYCLFGVTYEKKAAFSLPNISLKMAY